MKIMNDEASDPDMIIARMVQKMQIKFNQYWKKSYKYACIPVILDTCFKCVFLELISEDEVKNLCESSLMNIVKRFLFKLTFQRWKTGMTHL
jgi:hypothetical protein